MLQMLVERRELVAVEVHDAPAALALKRQQSDAQPWVQN